MSSLAPAAPRPRSRAGLGLRAALALFLAAGIAATAALLLRESVGALGAATAAVIGATTTSAVALRLLIGPLAPALRAVSDALLSFAEKDYGLRIQSVRPDELGEVVRRLNLLGDTLRTERSDVYQRELLLETVLEAAPMAIVLCDDGGRVVYTNTTARDFFRAGKKLEGLDFRDLLAEAPRELQLGLTGEGDALLTIERDGQTETLHAARRYFQYSAAEHVLYLLKPLTREIAAQETAVWKNAIRTVSHELNNSLAPISSLLHSGRMILESPDHRRLAAVFDVIEERSTHLRGFLEGYARFAKLPSPAPRAVAWSELLDSVKGLYPFQCAGRLPDEPGFFDPTQMQQVLINLLKNAIEAGTAAGSIEIVVERDGDGTALRVLDRGKGMSEDVLRRALFPFYSTKKTASGLGLPLCLEIVSAHGGKLSILGRDGGGTEARCWLPDAP